MKKILLFLIIVIGFLFTNCTEPSWENSIKNPQQFTTAEMLETPKDTLTTFILENNPKTLYVMDNEGKYVEHQTHVINTFSVIIPVGWLILIVLLFFIFGGVVINVLIRS